MINIKVLVTDFDKTLYRNPKELMENVKLINKFMKKNKFIIATGRAIYDIKPLIEKYNIKYDYIICNDGGVVLDSNDKKLLEISIDKLIVKKIVDYLKDNRIDYYYLDNGKDQIKTIGKCTNAIIIRDKEINISKNLLNNILRLDNSVHGYISDNWINIIDKKVSKGNAVEFLCKKFNIDKKDVFTIGDNINDISMVEKFNGYALNNSRDEVKLKSKGTFNSIKEFIEYIDEV